MDKFFSSNSNVEEAKRNVKALGTSTALSKWHEKWTRIDGSRARQQIVYPSEYTTSLPRPVSTDSQLFIGAAKVARTDRLRKLFEDEAVRFEAELSTMGLSLSKERL
jgi:hypothetical protein